MKYKYVDYLKEYSRIMQFNKNKKEPIHRWYSFVEGYSKDFIDSIIKEMGTNQLICLDPFSGSGTTALELQNRGIECYSFEVNPLMYKISKVKLEPTYNVEKIKEYFNQIIKKRNEFHIDTSTNFKTLVESDKIKKWNYDEHVYIAVKKIQYSIEQIRDIKYRDLFLVALSAILLDVSNLYRNGKCLSYKKNWQSNPLNEKDVFQRFDNKIQNEIITDIPYFKNSTLIQNSRKLFFEDCRKGIEKEIADNILDLVITSPPYLNSRDYTDTYMLELKTLFYNEYDQITSLRRNTIRSHVQIKWKDSTVLTNKLLEETLRKLDSAKQSAKEWNSSILDMVRLYFVDIDILFKSIYKKLKIGGKIYFNVSNSAYFNVLINTIEIICSLAENIGFKVVEIRKARFIHTSPQQKAMIGSLLEAVIIFQKNL